MKTNRRSGFTLAEAAIAMAVASILGAAVMSFYLFSLRSSYVAQQQINLQRTLRSITSEMLVNASRAHATVLYASSSPGDRDEITDRREFEVLEDGSEIHPTGDFAVFIYYEVPKPAAQPVHRIRRLVGYYTEDVDGAEPKLTRVTIEPDTPSTSTIEEILATHWSGGAGATVVRKTFAPRLNPLALSDNDPGGPGVPQLFYKRSQETIAVCGQIFESQARNNTKDWRTRTRTFFFTVSVRA